MRGDTCEVPCHFKERSRPVRQLRRDHARVRLLQLRRRRSAVVEGAGVRLRAPVLSAEARAAAAREVGEPQLALARGRRAPLACGACSACGACGACSACSACGAGRGGCRARARSEREGRGRRRRSRRKGGRGGRGAAAPRRAGRAAAACEGGGRHGRGQRASSGRRALSLPRGRAFLRHGGAAALTIACRASARPARASADASRARKRGPAAPVRRHRCGGAALSA
jgi:hypothetical protein